jgi:hypothetical protein
MSIFSKNAFIKFIFFGNYFYGFCAVMLSIETMAQLNSPPQSLTYLIVLFSLTVAYYNQAYLSTEMVAENKNERSIWYSNNKKLSYITQLIFYAIAFLGITWFILQQWSQLISITISQFFIIIIFPLVAFLYHGIHLKTFSKYPLRNIGWLKPFLISFTWSGTVTVYPILFQDISNHRHIQLNALTIFLFIQNFTYTYLLSVMFDIKDYAMDYNHNLKTLVVKLGLRKTLFFFLIPLNIIGLFTLVFFNISQGYPLEKILINTIPYFLSLTVAYSLHNRHSIFYYLFIIDGLLLVKAFCGIISAIYF